MFRLAHLSDLHLAPLPEPPLIALANKRVLGYLSWRRRRHKIHRSEVLEAVVADLRRQNADHVAITGDLTNISLPEEFTRAGQWLRTLGDASWVTVIPGNHDAYVRVPNRLSWAHWAAYMQADPNTPEQGQKNNGERESVFPFVRRRGRVGIVALSSACPTAPGLATGALGHSQIAAARNCLEQLREEGLFRCLLLHHPPSEGAVRTRKRLTDSAQFLEMVREQGAELVLHGHDHSYFLGEVSGPAGPVSVCGVPSASALPHNGRSGAQYHLYEIEPNGAAWRIRLRRRVYKAGQDHFQEEETITLNTAE